MKELLDNNTDDIDFETYLENSFKDNKKGEIIQGVVAAIKDDVVLVDIGRKVEARLNMSEFKNSDNPELKVGDSIDVLIVGYKNSNPIISYEKAISKRKIKEYIESLGDDINIMVEGTITNKNKGGYVVTSSENGISFFLPKSTSALKDDKNHINKKVTAKIIRYNDESGDIIISRTAHLKEQRNAANEVVSKLLSSDELIEGTIKKITSYGMFVDVGGIDGLVHYNEISYKGPVNPSSIYTEGEKVVVKPIEWDAKKRHLSLSIKQTAQDPWEEIKDELQVGDVIEVEVSNLEHYGAFVDLGNDMEAFLHISEITWDKNIKHPKEYLEVNQSIVVEVIEIDTEKRKLRVSLKKLQPKPFDEFLDNYKVGDKVTGKVVSITNFGAFLKVDKIEGLLLNNDSSWDKGSKCSNLFKSGDSVDVIIKNVDKENEKITFDRKTLLDTPVKEFSKTHKMNDIVKGTVKDIKDFGVFIQIGDNIDALIRKEDLYPLTEEELTIGKEIEAVLVKLDTDTNKVRVSVRRLERVKEKAALNKFNSEDKITMADMIK
jgi:small subunit ribosomal protein S1